MVVDRVAHTGDVATYQLRGRAAEQAKGLHVNRYEFITKAPYQTNIIIIRYNFNTTNHPQSEGKVFSKI